MNEPLLKGIRCVSHRPRPASGTERGIVKKRMAIAARVAACLLLIGVLVAPPLSAATEDETRIAAITAALAAGTDIAVIIQNAVAAGMALDRAVEVIVGAGVDPGRVVYAAITAGFSASEVVRGAANGVEGRGLTDAGLLTQMTTIVQAATQAGATPSQINSGLVNAGIPATVIAAANAGAATSSGPVYGYTAPPGTPPPAGGIGGTFGGGSGGGLIGGSGIGAPPTKPASPTKPANQP
jgi:hypothetical protein